VGRGTQEVLVPTTRVPVVPIQNGPSWIVWTRFTQKRNLNLTVWLLNRRKYNRSYQKQYCPSKSSTARLIITFRRQDCDSGTWGLKMRWYQQVEYQSHDAFVPTGRVPVVPIQNSPSRIVWSRFMAKIIVEDFLGRDQKKSFQLLLLNIIYNSTHERNLNFTTWPLVPSGEILNGPR
jgi:hypothetical protein